MVFPLAVPVYINEPLSNARWPVLQLKVQPRKHGFPVIRCSLSMPGRHQQRHPGSPRAAAGLAWSSGLRQGFQVAYQYQQVALEKSLQTLQRVGTLIRSTSVDCMAALGTKKQPGQGLPPPGQQPPEDEQQQAIGQPRASLSRFITTASNAEVANAAMLSDLSNLAYDVQAISPRRLQDTHNLSLVAHSKQAVAQLLPAGSAAARAQLEAAAEAEAASAFAQSDSSQLLQALPRPAAVRRSLEVSAAVSAGMPQSPAAAGAAPGGFAAYTSSSSSLGQQGLPPASPRTPFVLSSFAEADDVSAPADVQLATASGAVSSPGTPRRISSALSAAAPSRSSSLAAPPASFDAPLSQLHSSGSAGAALAAQLMQYQLQDVEALPAVQYQLPANAAEQQALLDLQQQEQLVLLEMQHTQQLQLLLQQEQAIMQQLQEQASLVSSDGADSTDGSDATGASSSGNAWWWLQQLQRQATAAAALATAAAAPSAAAASSSSSADAKPDAPPSDWFVCDGLGTDGSSAPVRYFVIQGSITLDHWRINLTIDPCEFEGGALGGVKVHRGVYEAALEMLEVFVPYVREHLAQHPDGKIAFTGHSLGGSLATLLMLLLVHRGILPVANVATVRTFGAPAIFCEGATGSPPAAGFCQSCSLPCQHRAERAAASAAAGAAAAAAHGASTPGAASGGLLGRLGLPQETVVNVVMTRDIVPRAFVCDYTLVADVLKSWLPSFKEHVGLADCKEHKALYNFIGTIEVLQPSAACPFVLPDEGHSMLPEQAALYKLTEPCCSLPDPTAAAAAAKPSFAEFMAQAAAAAASPCSGCSSGCSGSCSGRCSGHACGSASPHQEHDSSSCSSQHDAEDSNSSCGSSSSSSGSPVKKGKLGNFGSWGSLTSLSSMSLTSAIADLTSRFTLTAGNSSSGSIVSVPVTAEEAAAEAAAAVAGSVAESITVAEAAEHDDAPADVAAAIVAAAPNAALALAEASSSTVSSSDAAQPQTLGDAILTFMNSPHPLETLGEMRAYGPAGQISRFHNPNSYTQGLQQLCGVRVYEHSQ